MLLLILVDLIPVLLPSSRTRPAQSTKVSNVVEGLHSECLLWPPCPFPKKKVFLVSCLISRLFCKAWLTGYLESNQGKFSSLKSSCPMPIQLTSPLINNAIAVSLCLPSTIKREQVFSFEFGDDMGKIWIILQVRFSVPSSSTRNANSTGGM